MYKNYYASGYTAGSNVVTMDGYLDPTKRENTIITGNLVNEIQMGSATHTILVGAEMIDTTNNNHRYNTCLLYTSPSPRDATLSRMPSSA